MQLIEVHVELFPLVFEQNRFDFDKCFLDTLVSMDKEYFEQLRLTPFHAVERFKVFIQKRQAVHRPFKKTTLHITDEVNIGIMLHTAFKKCSKPNTITVDSGTKMELPSYIIYKSDNTEHVDISSLRKMFALGPDAVELPSQDIESIKTFVSEGFTLIGFKDKSALKAHHTIYTSLFLSGDDNLVKGSSQFLDALVNTLSSQGKIGIAKIKGDDRSLSRNVALLPQIEQRGSEGVWLPLGLRVVLLPYADEIRHLEHEAVQHPLANEINAALELIKCCFSEDINVGDFENPGLVHFFTALQALALNEKEVPASCDLLCPNVLELSERADVFMNFNRAFGLLEPSPHTEASTDVFDALQAEKSSIKKFSKHEDILEEIATSIKGGSEKLKLKDLVYFSHSRGLPTKKSDTKNSLLRKLRAILDAEK